MKQTSKTAQGTPSWTIEDIYNMLMFDIEPELMTNILPDLEELYPNESEEEKKERLARYAKAFEEFTMKFEEFMGAWKEQLHDFKKNILAHFKQESGAQDKTDLENLERSFGDQ